MTMKDVSNTHLKNMYLVIDTETLGMKAGKEYNQKVFDIGYQIIDKHKNVYSEGSFLVKEFWDRITKLKGKGMFYEKYDLYLERIQEGHTKIMDWDSIVEIISHEMACYDVDYFSAFNLAFDKRVIEKTNIMLSKKDFDLYENVEMFDIYHVACQLLLNRPSYKFLAKLHNKLTEKGNYQTGVESTYAYLKGQFDFKEEHTGLEDVKLESEILTYCLRQKKPFDHSINSQSWRLLKDTAPKPSRQLALSI